MLLGLHMLYFTSEGLEVARQSLQPLEIYVFFQLGIRLPWPVRLGDLFAALWIAFAASMVIAWLGPERSWGRVVENSLSAPFRKLFDNYLVSMPIFANMLLFAVLALTDLQETYGIPTGNIMIPDPFRGLVELSYSAVIEETAFRILPLGLVVFLHILVAGGPPGAGCKRFAWAFLHPERAKSQSGLSGIGERGLPRGLSIYEWGMVLFSAALFALAHILSGIGWQVGKLTTTFASGVVLGLVYLRYGFASPILMHWYFNYYGAVLEFAVNLYGEPISTFASLAELIARGTGGLAWVTLSLYLFLAAVKASRSCTRA